MRDYTGTGSGGNDMNWDQISVAGKRKMLLGKLQARYGVLKEEAEKQVDVWIAKVLSSKGTHESQHEKADKTS